MTSIKTRVLIAVCTCKRNNQLAKCLDSIVKQAVPADWEIDLLIVENDDKRTAEAVVDDARRQVSFNVFYQLETQPGIPFARNNALEFARQQHSDWLIFIDDDETAGEDWLLHFADAAKRYAADVIHGKVIYQLPEADRWAHLLERNSANERRVDGKAVRSAATNNVMFSARLFSADHMALTFDINMRVSGGSDTEFFNQARRTGARIVYSAKPVTYETVPLERCTFKRLVQRDARVAAAAVYIDASHYGKSKALRKHIKRLLQNFFQGTTYLIASLAYFLVDRVAAQRSFLIACLRFGRCYGGLLGMSGRLLSPYKTIDSTV